MYIDSNHAEDKQTRQSRTGLMIYINTVLIQWLSKKQPMIETSVLEADFMTMKHGIETFRGLRCKLYMINISISRPSLIYADNMSVIHSVTMRLGKLLEYRKLEL